MFFGVLYFDQVMGKVQLDCHSSSSSGGGGRLAIVVIKFQNGFFFFYSLLCTMRVAESSDANLKTV